MSLIHKALKKLETSTDAQLQRDAQAADAKSGGDKRKKILFVLMLLSILFFSAVYTIKYITKTGSAELGNARPVTQAQQNRPAAKKDATAVQSNSVTTPAKSTVNNSSEAEAARGNELFSKGKYSEAVEAFNKELKKSPDNPRLLNNIGISYFKDGQKKKARTYFTRALALKPGYAVAINNYGAIKASEGRSKEAIKLYKKAISIKQNFPAAHFNIAVEYEKNGKFADARREYETYLMFTNITNRQAVLKHIKELKAAQ